MLRVLKGAMKSRRVLLGIPQIIQRELREISPGFLRSIGRFNRRRLTAFYEFPGSAKEERSAPVREGSNISEVATRCRKSQVANRRKFLGPLNKPREFI
jgi:hypothetical protein